MEQLRERLTSFSIFIAIVAGFPMIAFKVYQTLLGGYELSSWPSMSVYVCLAIFAIFRKSIDYRVRASLSISLMFLTTFFGLNHWGSVEAAFVASLSSSILSIIILGRSTGIYFALFICGAGMTVAFVFSADLLHLQTDTNSAIELIARWWPQLLAIFSFYLSLAVSIGMIEGTLKRTIDQLEFQKRELEVLNQELIKSREVAEEARYTKSQFMSVMSHELKTPLNPIMGLINLLKEEPLNDESREYLELMENSSMELLTLINQILDYVHTDKDNLTPNMQPIHIREFCENLTKKHKPEAEEKGLDLTLNFIYEAMNGSETDFEIINDPNRLNQILSNLISNSIKFTNKGHIILGVDQKTTVGKGAVIEFTVSDTGIGISENVLDQIFEPFVQGFHANTRKYAGIGLGLSMVNKLCKLLNGSLKVNSIEGEGTQFTVSLPCDISDASMHPVLSGS